MGAIFAKLRLKPRTNPDAVVFALDLTTDAIVLHERPPGSGWKRFASVRLDDPELPIVIGLLRAEAEAHAGGHRPVRLWLPGEQVLKQSTNIEDGPPAARLRAAFDYIDRETVYRPKDVAVAVAPKNRNGKTTLLITFAETWREARDYATRWGFEPGDVSTLHHAGDFGAEGPVFHLHSQTLEPPATKKRNRLTTAGLALAIIAASAVDWSPPPWATPSDLNRIDPVTAVEITRVSTLAPSSPLEAVAPALVELAVARLPSPDPEQAHPPRDPVVAWTGPVPALALAPAWASSSPAAGVVHRMMTPPDRVEAVLLYAKGGAPLQAPLPVPALVIPPAEPDVAPVDATEVIEPAEAALPVPIPVPRPARTGPDDGMAETVTEPASTNTQPTPRPAMPGETETMPEPVITAVSPGNSSPGTNLEAEDPEAATRFASLTSPLPIPRPNHPAVPRNLPSATALPKITGATKPSIRAAATERGLPLEHATLIGVLNLDSGRKALLRLPDGRYRAVLVGDVIGGWRVSMIGTDAMRVTRDGEDRTLLLVNR